MIVAGRPFTRRVWPDHVRIAAVPVLPDAVADDDDRLGPCALVAGREITAEERLLSEHAERVGGEPCSARLLRQRAVVADVHRRVANAARPAKLRL